MTEAERVMILAARAAHQIEQLAQSPEHSEQAAVLPMLCGSGKSSGISEEICRTIETHKKGSKEGLLVIATNKDQMDRYLKPLDPLASDIITANRHLITLLTAETKHEGMARLRYTPVLIITAQRYFRSSPEEIKDLFLSFGDNCRRTLTLIDEQPPVYECMTLSPVEVNAIDTALRKGLGPECRSDDVTWCIQCWDRARAVFFRELGAMKDQVPAGRRAYSAKHDPCITIPEEVPKDVANPASRFWSIIDRHRSDLIRYHIENGQKGAEPYLTLTAMRQWLCEPSVYQYRNVQSARYATQFILRRDNTALLSPALGTRFVILDGTGRITPDYDDERIFHRAAEQDIQRDLSRATVHLFDMATGRGSFLADSKKSRPIIEKVYEKLAEHTDMDVPRAIFSYEAAEEVIRDYFPKDAFGHFGMLRGRNDFAEYHHVVQIGLNRYNPVFYQLYEYGSPESIPEAAFNEAPDITARSAMNRLLLASVEQSFFRGSIRSSDEEPYTFSLFLSFSEYGTGDNSLLDMLSARFRELGVEVLRHGKTPEEAAAKIQARKTVKATRPQLFLNWYRKLPEGAEYTTETLRKVMRVKPNAKTRDAYKNVPTIVAILEKDFVEKIGNVTRYRKNKVG